MKTCQALASATFILQFLFIPVISQAQEPGQTFSIHAAEMEFSKNVTVQDDHVVIWGAGNRYCWVAYPLSSIPFTHFSVDVEACADTADNRWPEIGFAVNDSSNFKAVKQVTSVNWQLLTFEPFRPSTNDSKLFLVFTNDYFNRMDGADLNLKLRNVTFHEVKEKSRSVIVSWDANPPQDSVAGYKVFHGFSSGNYAKEIDVGDTTEKEFSLEAGWTHYFAVKAYGIQPGDESVFSDEVIFEFQDEIQQDSANVTISWNDNPPEDSVAGYLVCYGLSSRHYTQEIDVGNTTAKEIFLEPGATYYFAVKAYGAEPGTESDFSEEVIFEFPEDTVDCDINGDGEINIRDWFAFRRCLNTSRGDDRYLEKADFTKDGVINSEDENIASSCFEQSRAN
ncbi:MAG: dockerin type I domain-containing protein [bacterium]